VDAREEARPPLPRAASRDRRRVRTRAPPPPIAQDESLATEAPQPSDDDLELRWTEDAASIERRVRAASPWPGAFTQIGDASITLTQVRRGTTSAKVLAALAPGEAVVNEAGVAIVRARDGAVELLRGRVDEDDDERELDAAALAALVSVSGSA
jgi:methionyl-tRNA formyltransferase